MSPASAEAVHSVPVPDGVEVNLHRRSRRHRKGPRASSRRPCPRHRARRSDDDGRSSSPAPATSAMHRSRHGLFRTLIANMVVGRHRRLHQSLELVGVGYRAAVAGSGRRAAGRAISHPVLIDAPDGIDLRGPQPTRIDRQRHRQAARRPGRRQHPQDPPARAVQGQGHQVRGRDHPPQGREGRRSLTVRSGRTPPARPHHRTSSGAAHAVPPPGHRRSGLVTARRGPHHPSKRPRSRSPLPGRRRRGDPDARQQEARGAQPPPPAHPQERPRDGDPAAPVGLPLQHQHLRPAHRRRRRPHAGRGVVARDGRRRQGDDGKIGVATPGRQARRRAREEQGIERSSSTAVATATPAASPPSPRAPAKPGLKF